MKRGQTKMFGLAGIPVMAAALVFGMMFIACEDDSPPGETPDPGITIEGWYWEIYSDKGEGGSSTITMTQGADADINKLTFSGSVGFIGDGKNYGYAGWAANPNDENMASLKNANSFSFKCIGDGKIYTVDVRTSDITDNAYYVCTFTVPETEETIEISYDDLAQPSSWGQTKPFNKNLIESIQFQAKPDSDITGEGSFNMTIWDLQVIEE
jgi:hypothetical protein